MDKIISIMNKSTNIFYGYGFENSKCDSYVPNDTVDEKIDKALDTIKVNNKNELVVGKNKPSKIQDKYVTGITYNKGDHSITVKLNDGSTKKTVIEFPEAVTDTNTFVESMSFDSESKVLTLERNDGKKMTANIDISSAEYDDSEIRSLITALEERMTTEENKVDNDTLYDDTEITTRVSVLEEKVSTLEEREDSDTVYDDTQVRELITALTERVAAVEDERLDVYDDTEVRALISALAERVAGVESREDSDTVYNDSEVRALISALTERVSEVEGREDSDTVYNDAEVRSMITELQGRVSEVESREDSDTVYDDAEVRSIISAIAERVSTLEGQEDSDTVYDDTEVRGLIAALTERVEQIDAKEDSDTVYDDTEIQGMISALAERLTAVENDPDLDTVYDDTEVRSLITALTERMTAEENKVDKDTVYDDTDIQSKYATLNTKYNTLFDYVYSQATGDAATPLNADYVANTLSNGNTSVTVTEGELGDVTIPETTKAMTVTAPMQDNSTITLSSPKAFTLINTSENPVDVAIDAPAGTSIPIMSCSGDFDTLEVNNGSISAKTGEDPLTATNVVINNDLGKNASVSGVEFNNNATISSDNVPKLGIANNNTEQNAPNATINAENSTVTLNKGQWNTLNSNVSDETLIITQNAHINTLNVIKGNVIVNDREISNRVGNVVIADEQYTISPNSHDVATGSELNSAFTGNPGIIRLTADITRSRLAGTVLASGNYQIDLNGHTLTISDTMFGLKARNTVNLLITDSVGTGKFISDKSYGLWAGENTVITINVPNTTEIVGTTHTLYCEGSGHPRIIVRGGTYKMLVEEGDTNVYDANGNYRYMLNHLDSTYTREGNCFTITGGVFVGFDPSRANGEPGGEYSMIDQSNYKVVTRAEQVDGMTVYEVVPL